MGKANVRIGTWNRVFNLLTLAGSILILLSLSYDIIYTKQYRLQPGLLELQFIVCLVFMADFFLNVSVAYDRKRFLKRNWLLLVVSLPYLNILQWSGVELDKSVYIVFKSLPLIRGMFGIYLVIWSVSSNKSQTLLLSYLFCLLELTYLCSLLFYAYETGRNENLKGFGDALWWAGMNVTTVGAELFAVTAIGKTMSVILPGLGMLMFPIFTVYITNFFQSRRKGT